jgi:rod shape-determining protein MreC
LRTIFLILLAIVLMVLDKRAQGFASIRAALSLPLAPFQYIVNWPAQMIDTVKSAVSTHDRLIEENLKLKSDQLLLQAQLQRLVAIESENDYLKALLQSSRQVKSKTLMAELLAIAVEPFVNQVILNKGSRDDVYVGQPVLDANGVLGQIVQVGPITSRVLLINDPHSGISVQNSRNGIRSIAVGDSYSDKIRLMYVPKTADIRVGDLFITSGLGGRYPEGYPVGKVITLNRDPTHPFATVYLSPSAHLNTSRQVLLVWYKSSS